MPGMLRKSRWECHNSVVVLPVKATKVPKYLFLVLVHHSAS